MKKIILILMIIMMSACSMQKDENINYDTKHMEDIASVYLDDMLNQKYNNIHDGFENDLKNKLSLDDLSKAIDKVVDEAGDYNKCYIIEKSEVVDGFYLVAFNLDFSNKNILLSISLNNEDKIVGIRLNYAKEFDVKTNDGEEIIKIDRISDYPLNALLTRPTNTKEDVACIIMIQGSGQSDLDETIGLNKPFKDIADGLKELGIATIRYDKRYYIYSELASEDVTVEDEITDDIMYLIDKAKTIKGIDPDKIYLLGHSLGAMLTPWILSQRDDIKGAILMAGSPRNLVDIIKDQNMNLYNELIKTQSEETIKEMDKQLEVLNSEIEKIKNLNEDSDMTEILLGASAKYWYSLNQKVAANYLDELDEKLFIIQGAKDFQVFKDIDYQMFIDKLGTYDNVKFKLYEDLNHLMMPSNGKTDSSEYNITNHISKEVIEDIASFIKG